MGRLYFKWWGIYTQGDGVGATGGKGGEGLASDYFMMRIGIPNGIVSSSQLRTIGGITRKYARNLADITVRQNIQLHWLTIESLPEVVDALDAIGLSPKGACGDVVRNVTGCPLAGVAHDELIDASPIALEIAHLLTANPDFYNLPRKFKISATRLPLLVHLSRDQRHRAHAGEARRPGWLLAARRRRPFQRAASRRSPRCIRPARSGCCRGRGDHRDLPRPAGPAREPRSRAPEVSLHERRLDGRRASSTNCNRASISRCCPASPKKCPTRLFAITPAFTASASRA